MVRERDFGKNKDRWKELCEQAANGQDPAKRIQFRDVLDDVPPSDQG